MKNILKIICLLFTFFSFFTITNWASWDITVLVSEKIPWAGCVCAWNTLNWVCYWEATWFDSYPPAQYKCTIKPWFSSIQSMIGQIIKWFTAIAALAWVLFIVINWILLSMWWEWKDEIKKRIVKTITWLILLLLSWVILSIIAPWVYK